MVEPLTPEELARDHDCDVAKREHKWVWLWFGDKMTDRVRCTTCGKEEYRRREDK